MLLKYLRNLLMKIKENVYTLLVLFVRHVNAVPGGGLICIEVLLQGAF